MKKEIGRLIQEQLLILILRLDHQLHRLFPYLLSYLIDALLKKTGNIRPGWIGLLPALLYDLFQ